MCEESSALTQAFFVASLRANTSCDEGIGPGHARHLDRRAIADHHLDLRLLAAVEHIGDQGRSAEAHRAEPANPAADLREIAVGVLAIPWKRLSIESRIWRPFGSFAGHEAGRVAQAVDREDVEAVRRAVAAVGEATPR